MLGPNAIVSTTIRLDPPLGGAPEEQLRSAADLSLELQGERRARLDAEDIRAPSFAHVLDQLSKQRMPVYLEVDPDTDPDTDFVTRLATSFIQRMTNGWGARARGR